MFHISKNLITSYLSNLVFCDAASHCADVVGPFEDSKRFCNFEDDVEGVCEFCPPLGHPCENSGLNRHGEADCKATCKGQ